MDWREDTVNTSGIIVMKIGIVTYWKSSCNYGEQLQNYALQEYLKKIGHDAFLIRYDYDNDRISRTPYKKIMKLLDPSQTTSYLKSVIYGKRLVRDGKIHPRRFQEFRERYLSMSRLYTSLGDLQNDPPEADMYITGSDQVWNTFEGGLAEMRNRLRVFFLDFGRKDVLRVSYAASWGRSELPEEEKSLIIPLLSAFNAVSVREKNGIDICRELGRKDATLALDPVLLHDAGTYRKLFTEAKNNGSERKYLFFYYMNNDGPYNRKSVFDWAEVHGLDVVYVTDDWRDDYKRSFPDVGQWLELIDGAECVLTNSYHCSLFCLIFGKRFGVIRRFGKYSGMNTRMDSVFEVFGIEPRYVNDKDFDVLNRQVDRTNKEGLYSMMTPDEVIKIALDNYGKKTDN